MRSPSAVASLCSSLVVIALSGCGVHGADCDRVVAKMRRCDPTTVGVSDAQLWAQCAGTQPSCVAMPVETPEQCSAFIGCLYGD